MVLIELFYSMGEEFWVDTGQIYTWTELNLNLVLAPHDKNLNWTEVHGPLWTDELKEVHLRKNFYSPANRYAYLTSFLQAFAIRPSQVARMLQASWGKKGRQQQEHNSWNPPQVQKFLLCVTHIPYIIGRAFFRTVSKCSYFCPLIKEHYKF